MPRPRGSEVPQRQSPRGPLQLRTSSSDSDSSHSNHRPIPDRSPKLGDRRSPRDAQPGSVNQKKLGTRIADLESQLGQAQVELKNLKTQLASAEAAKKEAQDELKKKTKKKVVPEQAHIQEKSQAKEVQGLNKNGSSPPSEVTEEIQQETDVFEVPDEKEAIEPQVEISQTDGTMKETKSIELPPEESVFSEPPEKQKHIQDLALKDDEINLLKNKLEGKEKELEVAGQENEGLKQQLSEATAGLSSTQAKEEEMALKLKQLEEELKSSEENNVELKGKLEAAEGAKEELETEMKKLRVQTEQWRKAADAAAAVLAGGVEMNGRIPERCGSMDKHFRGLFEVPSGGGYPAFIGSPGNADYMDDGFGGARRKNSGIKMFGDLWKKKSQK